MPKAKEIVLVTIALIMMGILVPIGIGLISGAGSQTITTSGVPEITKVEFKNAAGTTENETLHFTIVNNAGSDEEHYIWFSDSPNGADPSESGTGHEVNITGATTEADVRDLAYDVLNALDIEASFRKLLGGWLEIANDNVGDVADANQGTGDSSINSITIYQQGKDSESVEISSVANSTVLTLITVLVPILAIVGMALGFIPRMRG